MSVRIGPATAARRSDESKRLKDIIFASFRNSTNDDWTARAGRAGVERMFMRGDNMYYMFENPEESVIERIRRGFSEAPGREFYIVDDPDRADVVTCLLVSSEVALKILALGFLP